MQKNHTAYRDTVKEDEPAIITERIARPIAYPIALFFRSIGWSANHVTILAGMCWILSVPVTILAGYTLSRNPIPNPTLGWALWVAAGTLWNLGYILDVADGSLARMTHTASPSGFYLDYVFHLLFKPMFLASIGIALYLIHGSIFFLLLAVLSIPANWSASDAATHYVLCTLTGRKKLPSSIAATLPNSPDPHLWLGTIDSYVPAAQKTHRSPLTLLRLLAQEIFSYYGQFTFFSFLVGIDLLLSLASALVPFIVPALPRFPLTSAGFILLAAGFLLLTPFRVLRDFKRMSCVSRHP